PVDGGGPAGGLAERRRYTGAPPCADTCRPVDGDTLAGTVLPRLADVAQVLGQVVRRAAVVGAVDDRDVLTGEALALVQRLDRRVVPLLDVPEEDVREHRPGEMEMVRQVVAAMSDGRRRRRPGTLPAALGGGGRDGGD